jgi:hypothetical protein
MKTKIFLFDYNNLQILGESIKDFFINGGDYVLVKNYNQLTDDNILNYYNYLNSFIGKQITIDLKKNSYEPTELLWTDVKYDYGSDEKQFWRSSNYQNLHTDNSFANSKYYANLSELVCFKPCEYSGQTTIISNDKVIELIKFLDKNNNTNLFEKILNKKIYFSINNDEQIEKPILTYNNILKKYIFNFNYYPAKRAINTKENEELIEELHNFLEQKIMFSSKLMNEVKLNRGDCIIFNDENVLHGRRSFIGTRHYKKAGILLNSIIDNQEFIIKKK